MAGEELGNLNDITVKTDRVYQYAAFISYAHSDERRAKRLHNMLERYRPPQEYKDRRAQLRPVFRDKTELTASHSLSDDIRAAVEGSRKLIVLCSPAAKKSHWVNEEIRLFRALHGEGAILCALAEGTPETSFPPALTEGGREPLAADLSGALGVGKAENFRYGMMQLAASMLGVGLDKLVQRDAKRRRRIGSAVVLGALAFSGVMGASTYSAVKARELAETNRAEAEDLVEYMITDLRAKLQPVGRLDIVGGLGDKVMDYYSGQNIKDMPDDRIARQARAQHILGEVALDTGDYEEAKIQLDAAYALTREVLARNPEDTDAIFAHAQSAFWVGRVFKDQRLFNDIRPHWQEYHDLAYQLFEKDNNNYDWIMEAAWGENNMGVVERLTNNSARADMHYKRAIALFDTALDVRPNDKIAIAEKMDTIIGAEQLALSAGDYKAALSFSKNSLSTLEKILEINPDNMMLRSKVAEKKSDLLWQYAPLLSSEDRIISVTEPLDEFDILIRHDPENKKWRKAYIWHLHHSLQFNDTVETQHAVFQSMDDFRKRLNMSTLNPSETFAITMIEARQAWMMGYKQDALKLVETQSEYSEEGSQLSSPYIFHIADIYSNFGDRERAMNFAALYLAQNSNVGFEKRIEVLLRKGKAEVILGMCETAIETIAPVTVFLREPSPEILEIINCTP